MTSADDYMLARKLAGEIAAAFEAPRFHLDLGREREISLEKLRTDPILEKSRGIAISLDEDYGHGLEHIEKVAVDAGAIVQRESAARGESPERIERALLLAQLASLLHDIKRRAPEHAQRGAEAAAEILADFPVENHERDWIVCSIRNHEAFTEPTPMDSPEGQLLSDALYDADKFRWGPDNFTDTLWEMVSPNDVPMSALLAHFPKGMKGIERIAGTFRSAIGKQYGPEFIDVGIEIGRRLYEELIRRFPPGPVAADPE
jgi:hypothetical protein